MSQLRWRWPLILVISAGLIGMHHFLSGPTTTHPMGEDHSMPSAVTASAERVPDHPRAHDHEEANGGGTAHATVINGASPTRSTAEAGCCPGMGAMGHLCLAVLAAGGALIAVLMLLAVSTHPAVRACFASGVGPQTARAPPPAVDRLSQLCVLRL